MATEQCRGAARHWFSMPGSVGFRSPVCVRHGCMAPNPHWNDDNQADWDFSVAQGWVGDDLVRRAKAVRGDG